MRIIDWSSDVCSSDLLDVAAVLRAFDSLGEPAVHELLRRMVVNEMLGNPDMHLKNLGLVYPDGKTPQLAPAYDIVGYAAYQDCQGHALHILPDALQPRRSTRHEGAKPGLSPAVLRGFCAGLGIPEKPAAKVVGDCVKAAHAQWPALIAASALTPRQRQNLLAHFQAHAMVTSLRRSGERRGGKEGVSKGRSR